MANNEREGLGQEIEQMLDRVERKIREIKELNRPAIEFLDKQEIDRRIKALEERDEADKQAINDRIRTLESHISLINNRLYIFLLVLSGVCAVLVVSIGIF